MSAHQYRQSLGSLFWGNISSSQNCKQAKDARVRQTEFLGQCLDYRVLRATALSELFQKSGEVGLRHDVRDDGLDV